MRILRSLGSRWSEIARRIVSVQTTVLLSVVYYVVMLPVALVLTFAVDNLGRKPRKRSMWVIKRNNPTTIADLREQ